MCLIVLDKRENSTERVSRDVLERCVEKYPHGLGIMWPHEGQLRIWKSLDDFDGLWNRYTSARDRGARTALHFRYTTEGDTTWENCHPFWVFEPDPENQSQYGLGFMHNGTMRRLTKHLPKGFSDSRYLAEDVLQKAPFAISSPAFKEMLRGIGWDDRFLFMDGKGRVTIVNESVGFWHKGVWYSHDRDRAFVLHGYQPKAKTQGHDHGASDPKRRSNGHTRLCICSDCRRIDATEENDEDSRWHKGESRRANCEVCKEVQWTIMRNKKKAGDGPYKVCSKCYGDLLSDEDPEPSDSDDPFEILTSEGPDSSSQTSLIFLYDDLREDLGGDTVKGLKKIADAEVHGVQLWAVDNPGGIMAGAIWKDDPAFVTRGQLFSMQSIVDGEYLGAEGQLKWFDTRYGCDIEVPKESFFYRVRLPARCHGGSEYTLHPWVYILNPNLDLNELEAVVPFGDWREWLENNERETEGQLHCPQCGSDNTQVFGVVEGDEYAGAWCWDCKIEIPLDEEVEA